MANKTAVSRHILSYSDEQSRVQGKSRARKGGGEGCKKMAPRNISGIFFQNHMETAALRVVREKDRAVTHFTEMSPLNLFLNGGFWRRITRFSGGNGGGISRRQQIMKKNDCH